MAAETLKFKIDGTTYDMPDIDDLSMEEWQIIYDVSGIVMSDFAPALDAKGKLDKKADAERQRRVQNPAFLRARLQVAYARANPGATQDEIDEVVISLNMVDAMEHIADAAREAMSDDAEDERPLALTPEPEGSLPTGNGASSGKQTTASSGSSGQPAADPVPTGT